MYFIYLLLNDDIIQIKGLGQECSPSSSGNRPSSSENAQETQFLATALQKPLNKGKQGQTTPTPPLLSAYPPPATPLSAPSLPSIDLGLAISNFTNNAANSSNASEAASTRKRRMIEQLDISTRGEHLSMTDMTPPSSIKNEESQDSNHQQRQDPLTISSVRTEMLRPYQSQCRGIEKTNILL